MIGVLVVDDHPALRAGLSHVLGLAEDIELLGAAAGGEEGVRLAAALGPQVVLMDLVMPGLDGPGATRAIVASSPTTRVVVLTSFGDRPRILDALEAGAVGYLLKDAEPDVILEAIRAAAAGGAPLDPRAAHELLVARRERPTQPQANLTARERELLALVAAGHANKVIALRLGISHKTVRNTLSSAFGKIGVSDRTQAALWAQQAGLA